MKKVNYKLVLNQLDLDFLRYLSIHTDRDGMSYGKLEKYGLQAHLKIRHRLNKFMTMGLVKREFNNEKIKITYFISEEGEKLLNMLETVNNNLQKKQSKIN